VLEQINLHANILPVFFNNRDGAEPLTWQDSVRRTLVSKMFKGTEKITTTRLDTDDCLHQNFMSEMLRVAERLDLDSLKEQPIAISFPFGAQEIGSRLLSHHQATNAFITLVEAATSAPSTVFQADHNKVHTFAHLKNVILQQPMWLQVIHSKNVSNAEKPNLPELGPREELLRQFGVTRSSRRRN
jgi:hypothetical protein